MSLLLLLYNLISLFQEYYIKCKYYFVMKISNKRELQQTVFNHSEDIDF